MWIPNNILWIDWNRMSIYTRGPFCIYLLNIHIAINYAQDVQLVRTSACKVWMSLPFTLEEMQLRTQRPCSESTCSTLDNGVCRTLKTISTPTKHGRITTWFELSLLSSFLLSKLCPDNNMRSSLLELISLMFPWRWFM